MRTDIKKIVIGISGASGVHLGLKLIQSLPESMELFIIISEGAKEVAYHENKKDIKKELEILLQGRSFYIFDENEMSSCIASGSFGIDAMAIVPTSMNLLAKIANGLCDDLLSRCASVMLKERRILLLAPREMPLSAIALEQMSKLAQLGVIIAPPIVAYYAKAQDIDSMELFFVGKWLDALGIQNNLYKRWENLYTNTSIKR